MQDSCWSPKNVGLQQVVFDLLQNNIDVIDDLTWCHLIKKPLGLSEMRILINLKKRWSDRCKTKVRREEITYDKRSDPRQIGEIECVQTPNSLIIFD